MNVKGMNLPAGGLPSIPAAVQQIPSTYFSNINFGKWFGQGSALELAKP
jgi:hypothetical protein